MGWWGLFELVGNLLLLRSSSDPSREVELIDDDFGTVTGLRGSGEWRARMRVQDPAAKALLKMSGDDDGPDDASRRRALMLLDRWSELAAGPISEALVKRELENKTSAYRSADRMGSILSRHRPRRVTVDLRRDVPKLTLRFRGDSEPLSVRLDDWPPE